MASMRSECCCRSSARRQHWRHRQPRPARPPSVQSLCSWKPVNESAADLPPVRSRSPARFGIACLVRGCPPAAVRSFVRYHLRVGCERIYLYLDAPDEPEGAELVERLPELLTAAERRRLALTRCDGAFWASRVANSNMVKRRSEQRVFDDVARCWRTEAQSRQSLVVEHAIEEASAIGLGWLVS